MWDVRCEKASIERIATLLFGESVTHEVAPGPHKLTLNNALVRKTLRLEAQPGREIEFVFANRPGRFTLGFLALRGVAPLFLSIERRS